MELPPRWVPVSSGLAGQLEAELRREAPTGHRLHGLPVRAVARRQDRDDVLFRSLTEDGPVFCVHLTWSIEVDPVWPWTDTYDSMDDFLERARENPDAP